MYIYLQGIQLSQHILSVAVQTEKVKAELRNSAGVSANEAGQVLVMFPKAYV